MNHQSMKKIRLFSLIGMVVIVATFTQLQAHIFSPMQWYHMHTPHFNLIFTSSMRLEARKVAQYPRIFLRASSQVARGKA